MPDPNQTPAWTPAGELRAVEPPAVEILWHPARRVHLAPFLGRVASLGEAARQLGIKKPAMSYWLTRLLDAGLVRTWDEARVGRQRVPRYRSVADRFRVRLEDAPLASYEGVFDDVSARWQPVTRQALARAVARQSAMLDLSVYVDGAGGLSTTLLPREGAPPRDDFLYCWGRLWLTPAERDSLRAELDALWDRYAALSDTQHKPCATLVHLVHVAEP